MGRKLRARLLGLGAALVVGFAGAAQAAGAVNIYSSRHYDTDERLYSDFEKATGIKVNRIEDEPAALIARLKAEAEASPADVYVTTDAGRLWTAEEAGLFQPVASKALAARLPAALRHPQNLWFGFSTRARIIFYDKARVSPNAIKSYFDLADPKWKGMVCTRSATNVYMISLMAAMIAHYGEAKAESWGRGLWANRARNPAGGDIDQLSAIASGECGIALANTYYFARAFHLKVPGLAFPQDTNKIGWVFPDQNGFGAHINISGAGLLKHAPDKANAIKFLEYLASDSAQNYFASGNDEYPAVKGIATASEVVKLGAFKADELNLSELGKNQAAAIRIYAKVGYK
ncbi:MAG: extracellular solute-binding protein [Alphaproteobacteria bacterium]